ncbi:MAG: glycosyltransferase [bacterium]|nr:glycosyltransferase [bacterium]
MMRLKFSLVVTCFNEMKSLPQWYKDLEAQTRQPDEIIIVDNESTDGTGQFLRSWAERDPRLKLIIQKCSIARGHNIGNEAAKYEHIVSTDMGIRIDPRWFEEIVRPFEEDLSVEVVAGSYAVDMGTVKTAAARAEYYVKGDQTPILKPGFIISNRSSAYKKEVWRQLGGFPEDLTRCAEDSVFGRQIVQKGYKMAFAPQAKVYWARHAKLKDFWKETKGYGIGDGEAHIKTPMAFRLYEKGILPRFLVPPLTALRLFSVQIRRVNFWLAIKRADFVALAFIPLLLLGNGWYFAKGYLIGDERGKRECRACRSRLSGGSGHMGLPGKLQEVPFEQLS